METRGGTLMIDGVVIAGYRHVELDDPVTCDECHDTGVVMTYAPTRWDADTNGMTKVLCDACDKAEELGIVIPIACDECYDTGVVTIYAPTRPDADAHGFADVPCDACGKAEELAELAAAEWFDSQP